MYKGPLNMIYKVSTYTIYKIYCLKVALFMVDKLYFWQQKVTLTLALYVLKLLQYKYNLGRLGKIYLGITC